MTVDNIPFLCQVWEININNRGLIMKVLPDDSLPFTQGVPVLIVVPYSPEKGYSFHGETMYWEQLAEKLAECVATEILKACVIGTMGLTRELPLYPKQPQVNWPKDPTYVITAKHLTIK